MPVPSSMLPGVNAVLNATSAVLLLAGYLFIRRRNTASHAACMGAAFAVSILFLLSYLTYHYLHGSTRFQGTGWVRPLYFVILISHTVLAVAIVPLALRTLFLALRNRLVEHERIARWTLPLWLYVSVTGVVVYLMLYQIDWASACPACKDAISSAGDPELARRLTVAYARSIYFLMATPYVLFAGLAFAIVRAARRKGRNAPAADRRS